MGTEIGIILRVFNRVEDLKINLQLIRESWKSFAYHPVISFNGRSAGYELPEEIRNSYVSVEIGSNRGHREGASDLLKAALPHIPEQCEFMILLEADSWIYGDTVIKKYISLLRRDQECVWASANWEDKFHSQAIDFAIARTSFLRKHPEIFDFSTMPEYHIYDFIQEKQKRSMLIKEISPVHIPGFLKRFSCLYDLYDRRRLTFPLVPMATHHVELLKNGISEKKGILEKIAGKRIFHDNNSLSGSALRCYRLYALFTHYLARYCPKSFWIKGRLCFGNIRQ